MSPLQMLLVGGLALVVGASLLVRGAARLAMASGISALVVGLTVVAFGTSAPELAVTVQAAMTGRAGVAVGNVVGSNVFNVLLILGMSAAITPLVVAQRLVRREIPLMIGISAAVPLLCLDGRIGRLEGLLLGAGITAYTVFLIRESRSTRAAVRAEYDEAFGSTDPAAHEGESADGGEPGDRPPGGAWDRVVDLVSVLAGLGLLVLGARWLVDGAVEFATRLGLSEAVVGLTVVAAGTSLPEAATSAIAAARGERDIAVGNVVGSNLFNLMAVLGVAGTVAPAGLPVAPALLHFDMPVMVAVAVACLPVFFTGYTISRWEGWLFLAYYGAYTAYLVLEATQHEALPAFNLVMVAFVLPLTVVTLVVLAVRQARGGDAPG